MKFKGLAVALSFVTTMLCSAGMKAEAPANGASPDKFATTEITANAEAITKLTSATTSDATTTEVSKTELTVNNLSVSTISVSCLKLEWDGDENRSYQIDVSTNASYPENITFIQKENDLWYLTGLRENSAYDITITPSLSEGESVDDFIFVPENITGQTEKVFVIQEYEREKGVTNCFAGEKASGLTQIPSSEAIAGSVKDPITGTCIRRNEYGDYCCAMGLFYGRVGDRFLIELENGTQFTVAICDSKGMADDIDGDGIPNGRFHWFGEDGKCIVEFIHDGDTLPDGVSLTGSWGAFNWNGLNLTANILRIQKIEYGNPIEY